MHILVSWLILAELNPLSVCTTKCPCRFRLFQLHSKYNLQLASKLLFNPIIMLPFKHEISLTFFCCLCCSDILNLCMFAFSWPFSLLKTERIHISIQMYKLWDDAIYPIQTESIGICFVCKHKAVVFIIILENVKKVEIQKLSLLLFMGAFVIPSVERECQDLSTALD